MNSEDEASGYEAESGSRSGSGSESDGVAGLAFASRDVSAETSSSFFTNNSSEDETPAYCFMAKAKVSSPNLTMILLIVPHMIVIRK